MRLITYRKIEAKVYGLIYKLQDWIAIRCGYIDSDYEPLKCPCGCTELEECNQDYLDTCYRGTILEYDCRCKQCGKILGHWAYGYWQR